MKDLYSFSKDDAEHADFYAKAREAYTKVFARVGLGDRTYVTFASGGIFSPFSEEFQTLSDAGEDTIYVHEAKQLAVNKEVYTDEALATLGLSKDELIEKKAIEVGNIFNLGTRFSEALGLGYTDETGERKSVVMGSYGIGPTRLMGVIAEVLSDEKGLVWPESVAPFKYHLLNLLVDDAEATKLADSLYVDLSKKGEVLFDDRDARAGEKFADADLIGIPWRVVVGKDTLKDGTYELVNRATGEVTKVSREDLLK